MANTKISALTADTAPTADDLVVTVNDPGGTPATKKATITNFTKAIPAVVGDSGSGGTKGLVPAPGAGDAAAGKYLDAAGGFSVPPGSGAPTNATYITQTANGTLSNEQAMGSLATGIVKNTTTTGVQSIATVDDISAPVFAQDAGANDTYTATLSPAPAGYTTGTHYRFKANTANTGAATINFNSLGAKTIKKAVGGITTDLDDNDIRAGQWVDLVYDGTNMQMQSNLGNAGSGGAPTNATYITQTADGTLSNEQALGALATGILKSTTTTGVVSIADVNDISSPVYAADAGSNDTYVATLSPVPSAYVTGAHYRFKANTANTGACTINFNSLGAKTIKKAAGGVTTDLADNDIRAGQWVDLIYDGTNMQMQSTLGNAPSASPGGSDTYVQFNDGGTFGGDVDLTWAKSTNTLTLSSGGAADASINVSNGSALGGSGSSINGLRMLRDYGVQWSSSAATWNSTVDLSLFRFERGFLMISDTISGNKRFVLLGGVVQCTSNFTKSANTTLGTITGMTAALLVSASTNWSSVYAFTFEGNVDADATGGFKFAVAYSASLTSIEYYIEVINDSTGALVISSRQTSSGGSAGAAGPTSVHVRITGSVSVAGNGNLTVQFAQNAASGTSTVRQLASLICTPIP